MLGSSDYSRSHDAEPKAALEALMHHDGPLLLDLDEMAYLRNSTEDFLDTASRGLPALLLLRLLDADMGGQIDAEQAQIFERISQHHAFRHRFLAERIKHRRDFAAQPVLGRVQPARDDLRGQIQAPRSEERR